ncbi:MAG: hypothetical protein A2Z25_02125 [Planctomycetes bacterium RBG_16_55_9]|nr:MAG: hypothetical protein A2Z25_02125 [Planctomycetes bacterium RBG_16_55_9]
MESIVTFKTMFGRNQHGAFILATFVLVLTLGFSTHRAKASALDTETSIQAKVPAEVSESVSTINELPEQIKELVTGLEYPDEVAEDFTRMAMAWKWKDGLGRPVLVRWKEKLSNTHQEFRDGKITRNQVANIEEDVLEELCKKIKKEFSAKKIFELSDVIEHRQANCLGYSQLTYIIGNAIGLSVRPIDALDPVVFVEGKGDAKGGHVASIVDLFDGQLVMADMTWFYEVSLAFKLEDQFVKVGNYWELKDKDNPLFIHRRIRLLDRRGLLDGIYNNRGVVFKSKGEYDRAILEFNKAIETDPGFAKPYFNRGNTYADKGEFERAILDYAKAIEIDPKYAMAYMGRGNIFDAKGEHDHAIADHTKSIEINPRFTEAYNNRGIAYTHKSEFDLAILDLSKAIEIDPNYAIAYTNRGNAFYDKGEYDRAIADHTKAIEINPRFTEAYNNRGVTYADNGESDRAILDFTKAIELNPKDADAFINRGKCYCEEKEYGWAMLDFIKAIGINLKSAITYILLDNIRSEQYQLDLNLD